MLADAHIHLVDLLDRDPGFPERLANSFSSDSLRESPNEPLGEPHGGSPWTCCAASHDEAEWDRTQALRRRLPPFVSSFGIHPQWAVWKNADFLARLAAEGRIAAIGEAGFDFYGDRPERVRSPENESAQRAIFEYQLDLAERCGLPILLHLRKAMDLAFAYAPRMKRLSAAIFHSFSGTSHDAESLLARGVNAYFSFGASLLNGNKRAAEACASVPEDRLLSETDAPWQPPKRARPEGAALGGGDFCRAQDIAPIVAGMAALRGVATESLEPVLSANFRSAFTEERE